MNGRKERRIEGRMDERTFPSERVCGNGGGDDFASFRLLFPLLLMSSKSTLVRGSSIFVFFLH